MDTTGIIDTTMSNGLGTGRGIDDVVVDGVGVEWVRGNTDRLGTSIHICSKGKRAKHGYDCFLIVDGVVVVDVAGVVLNDANDFAGVMDGP